MSDKKRTTGYYPKMDFSEEIEQPNHKHQKFNITSGNKIDRNFLQKKLPQIKQPPTQVFVGIGQKDTPTLGKHIDGMFHGRKLNTDVNNVHNRTFLANDILKSEEIYTVQDKSKCETNIKKNLSKKYIKTSKKLQTTTTPTSNNFKHFEPTQGIKFTNSGMKLSETLLSSSVTNKATIITDKYQQPSLSTRANECNRNSKSVNPQLRYQQQKQQPKQHKQRVPLYKIEKGFCITNDVEEIVLFAASLLATEIRTGKWVCPSPDTFENNISEKQEAITNLSNDIQSSHEFNSLSSLSKLPEQMASCDRPNNEKDHGGKKVTNGNEETATTSEESSTKSKDKTEEETKNEKVAHLCYIAAAIENFATEIIIPSLNSAGVGERNSKDKRYDYKATDDRVFLSTMLSLRELLILNADSIFFDRSPEDKHVRSSLDPSLSPVEKRRKLRHEKQEIALLSQIISTTVIISTFERLDSTLSKSLVEQFSAAVTKYDNADTEFSSCLERADGQALGVHPDGRMLNGGENIAWRVSFNHSRDNHPLIKACLRRKINNYIGQSITTNIESQKEHYIANPSPTASFVSVVEKIPVSSIKLQEAREEEHQRQREVEAVTQKYRRMKERLKAKRQASVS